VEEILSTHEVEPLPRDIQKDLDAIIEEAKKELIKKKK
jgi:hypothetical protein